MKDQNKVFKIAFVSTMAGVAWGGSEELWSQAALRLRQQGHDVSVSVFGWHPRPARVAELAAAGAAVSFRPLRLAFPRSTIEKLRQRLAPTPVDRESMAWLEKEKPDLVIISQGWAWDGVPWMAACREFGIPYCPIVHAHSEIWWPMDEDLPDGRSALAGAQRVFFVSHANHQMMERQCGMHLANAEVVVNPWKVDASQPVAWPEESGMTEIACVGRIDPRAKGQDLLMQVMAMPKWRERPIRLNIYGDGPCEESMKALAEMLELRNVYFRGQVPDVRAIWAKNHALVLPSRFEGLPLVIIEAMFCGRPVITTEVAGNAEYLREGVTGFIADAPTVKLLDEAMERAWSRRSDWAEMGSAARRDLVAAIPSDPIGKFSERLLALLEGAAVPLSFHAAEF